ncbi:hypothetical protein SJAG_02205 [Schizosaccharomyces japonicus yFS275]|uniref:Cystathionine gamma-synthase n=1 Tax=Schizosaccharomyces japonicus (strain yFS275 / FY16936) TaxID=402676 RepID=B6K1U3_SCHJY|nr:hypothetical protein SJAG_02205 [Schizosaccharomyces japonicus yFS275]EEB07124.1 hypothetical protein SJAG_02205 [Schizosaccharomyces japonicus yFS275]
MSPVNTKKVGLQTALIHSDDAISKESDVSPAIHLSTTYDYDSDAEPIKWTADKEYVYYSRIWNETTSRAEAAVSAIVNANAVLYASGLAAIFALFTHLHPKRVAIHTPGTGGYGGVVRIIDIMKRLSNTQVLYIDENCEGIQKHDLIFLESPINPSGECCDIAYYAKLAHSKGALLAVDSTLAPPPLQDPFTLGADYVVHSATKYLAGHSDVLAGIVATKDPKVAQELRFDRIHLGSILQPVSSHTLLRSLRTFSLRIQQHSKNGYAIAQHLYRLSTDAEFAKSLGIDGTLVKKVHHDSLQTESFVRKTLVGGHVSCFSVVFRTPEIAKKFCTSLQFFHHATSLGSVESLCEWRLMSDPNVNPSLVRLSIGIEDISDLISDINRVLASVTSESKTSARGDEQYDN